MQAASSVRKTIGVFSIMAIPVGLRFMRNPDRGVYEFQPAVLYEVGLALTIAFIAVGMLAKVIMVFEKNSENRPSVKASWITLGLLCGVLFFAVSLAELNPDRPAPNFPLSQNLAGYMMALVMPFIDLLNIMWQQWDLDKRAIGES